MDDRQDLDGQCQRHHGRHQARSPGASSRWRSRRRSSSSALSHSGEMGPHSDLDMLIINSGTDHLENSPADTPGAARREHAAVDLVVALSEDIDRYKR